MKMKKIFLAALIFLVGCAKSHYLTIQEYAERNLEGIAEEIEQEYQLELDELPQLVFYTSNADTTNKKAGMLNGKKLIIFTDNVYVPDINNIVIDFFYGEGWAQQSNNIKKILKHELTHYFLLDPILTDSLSVFDKFAHKSIREGIATYIETEGEKIPKEYEVYRIMLNVVKHTLDQKPSSLDSVLIKYGLEIGYYAAHNILKEEKENISTAIKKKPPTFKDLENIEVYKKNILTLFQLIN